MARWISSWDFAIPGTETPAAPTSRLSRRKTSSEFSTACWRTGRSMASIRSQRRMKPVNRLGRSGEATERPSNDSVSWQAGWLVCPTTEEYILPIIHGNDRVEWFVQATDEIIWDIEDGNTGNPRAKVVMKAG